MYMHIRTLSAAPDASLRRALHAAHDVFIVMLRHDCIGHTGLVKSGAPLVASGCLLWRAMVIV